MYQNALGRGGGGGPVRIENANRIKNVARAKKHG